MKKYTLLFCVLLLYICIGCIEDSPGSTPPDPTHASCHMRNTSTSSGVYVEFFMVSSGYRYYLAPSPQVGIPVDTTVNFLPCYTLHWWVERAIDSVVIDSGSFYLDRNKWLLIEEDNGDWTCTWSNTGWE